jgi:hypothetical protein
VLQSLVPVVSYFHVQSTNAVVSVFVANADKACLSAELTYQSQKFRSGQSWIGRKPLLGKIELVRSIDKFDRAIDIPDDVVIYCC